MSIINAYVATSSLNATFNESARRPTNRNPRVVRRGRGSGPGYTAGGGGGAQRWSRDGGKIKNVSTRGKNATIRYYDVRLKSKFFGYEGVRRYVIGGVPLQTLSVNAYLSTAPSAYWKTNELSHPAYDDWTNSNKSTTYILIIFH